ncbi:MAG: type II toxin-antitoxin system CcdA family antitoxin [Methanosarcinales archaeon]
MRKTVRISVTIRKDQKELLDRHREVNISGLLQKAIDEELWYLKEMDKEKLKIY